MLSNIGGKERRIRPTPYNLENWEVQDSLFIYSKIIELRGFINEHDDLQKNVSLNIPKVVINERIKQLKKISLLLLITHLPLAGR